MQLVAYKDAQMKSHVYIWVSKTGITLSPMFKTQKKATTWIKKISKELGVDIEIEEFGDVAQLGERMLCKHDVVGSIPSISTKFIPR